MSLEHHDLFDRYLEPKSSLGIDREVPRCIAACPAGCDVKGYIELIAEKKYDEAYSLIKETIPFPGILGRVCDHPCELNCKRSFFDDPLSISSLKRYAADHASESKVEETIGVKEKSVAVVGSGPAGLTATIDLSKNGYRVKVFEKNGEIGGMLRLIPEYELPKRILDEELNGVIKEFGIEIERNCAVGTNVSLGELMKEHDAVIIAVGLPIGRVLNLEGSNLEGVEDTISFLKKVNSDVAKNLNLGKRIVVVGGGNTAIDAARSIRRLGKEVKMIYRRSREEMPARAEKVEEAEKEGVELLFLTNPTKILGNGRVNGVKCIVMKLGEPDKSGRRRPIPLEGTETTIETDNIIWGVGQVSDISFLDRTKVESERGLIKVDQTTLTTSKQGIFAAGDIVRGPASVVEAIADGHRVAESVSMFLRGLDLSKGRSETRGKKRMLKIPPEETKQLERMREESELERTKEGVEKQTRRKTRKIEMEKRTRSFEEVDLGLSEEAAIKEAKRCFGCRECHLTLQRAKGRKINIDEFIDRLISSTGVAKCIDCGECTGSCPVATFDDEFSPRRIIATAAIGPGGKKELVKGGDIWKCTTCGICNEVCPYGVDFVSFILGVREVAASENYQPRFSEQGLLASERISSSLNWVTDDLEVAEKGEIYYFSGCISYLNRVYSDIKNLRLLEIPRSTVRILNSIGVIPAVSEDEKCCGHDLFWTGYREKTKELARDNIEAIKETGAKTVIFSCPEGVWTFMNAYKSLLGEELDLKFMHISEFLKDKQLPLRGGWEEEVLTYHDSCRLKYLNLYDEPRNILGRIPNVKIVEMKHIRKRALCCGVSAMATCGPIARKMEVERLVEAKGTGASKLIVPCPKCLIHFNCALLSNPFLSNGFSIAEFTTTIADHLIPNT